MIGAIIIFAGLLVTGGGGTDVDDTRKSEVIVPNGWRCSMPILPILIGNRIRHSQSFLTACGGSGSWDQPGTSCLTFNGEWEQSHELNVDRGGHVSWQSPDGILLMGGTGSGISRSSELLSNIDTTSSPRFDLADDT